MKRCKHSQTRQWFQWDEIRQRNNVQHRCGKCDATLSLGPSNDVGVEHEIRAAHLAHGENNEHEFTDCEWMGWNGDETYSSGVYYHSIDRLPTRNIRQWHTGYLARCIVEHDESGCGREAPR